MLFTLLTIILVYIDIIFKIEPGFKWPVFKNGRKHHSTILLERELEQANENGDGAKTAWKISSLRKHGTLWEVEVFSGFGVRDCRFPLSCPPHSPRRGKHSCMRPQYRVSVIDGSDYPCFCPSTRVSPRIIITVDSPVSADARSTIKLHAEGCHR